MANHPGSGEAGHAPVDPTGDPESGGTGVGGVTGQATYGGGMSDIGAFRDLTPSDGALLRRATLLNLNWTGEERVSLDEVLSDPALRHYTEMRPERGDLGVVAEREDAPIGVAWAVMLGADDPGFGFVADGIPEVSLCVWPEHRGRGVGEALLRGLLAVARERGLRALSLSVESPNPSERLYRRLGAEDVAGAASGTMLLDLSTAARAPGVGDQQVTSHPEEPDNARG